MFKRLGLFLLLAAVFLPALRSYAEASAAGTWSVVSKTNIDFSTSGAHITAQEQTVLEGIAKDLAAHPAMKVSVQGFADSTGTDERNNAVASRRAKVVAKALAALGIGSARFAEVVGEGASHPLGDNATEAGRRLNRRVEVRVLESGSAPEASAKAMETPAATAVETASDNAAPAVAGAPQFFLNLDGLGGYRFQPKGEDGHYIVGGEAGLEYIPDYLNFLGVDVDYSYLAVGKQTQHRDQDVNLSLRGIFYKGDTLSGWLQIGAGYNTTENSVNDHVDAFVQPGVRWAVLPRLAVDGGVRYLVATPQNNFMQAVALMLGLTVPLDGSYAVSAFSGK